MSEMKPYPEAPEMWPSDNSMSYLYRWNRFVKEFNLINEHNNAIIGNNKEATND